MQNLAPFRRLWELEMESFEGIFPEHAWEQPREEGICFCSYKNFYMGKIIFLILGYFMAGSPRIALPSN